jgi:hypothetical protein
MADFSNDYFSSLTEFMNNNAPDGLESKVFYAQDSDDDPLQEVTFWRSGSSRVYCYSGLEQLAAPYRQSWDAHGTDAKMCIGVLMLDDYAIQNKVGDTSNPFTFWPYTSLFAVPKGIDFAKCKAVGASQGDGHEDNVKTICAALNDLVQCAGERGFDTVFITGDCGYYALALQAYSNELLAHFNWEMINGTVAFKVLGFRVPINGGRSTATVRLALGSSQMIADPAHSITHRLDKAAVLYSTADLRGWYTGDSELMKKIHAELEVAYEENHFPGSNGQGSMWWSANEGLLWGCTLEAKPQYAARTWNDVAPMLIEGDAAVPFVIGMYIGAHCWKKAGQITNALYIAPDVAEQILKDMHSSLQGFYDWLVEGLSLLNVLDMSLCGSAAREIEKDPAKIPNLSKVLKAVLALFGGKVGDEIFEQKYLNKQFHDAVIGLLKTPKFQEGLLQGGKCRLPVGFLYIQWYSEFVYHLNVHILAKYQGKKGNLFEAHKLYFLDVLCVPAFGQAVAKGWTVWSYAQSYFWINSIFASFAAVVQKHNQGVGLAYHMECTELLSYLGMLQDDGMFVMGNVNYLYLASIGAQTPLMFVPYQGDVAPAAIMCLHEDGKKDVPETTYYRRKDVPVRFLELDSQLYAEHRDLVYPPGCSLKYKEKWALLAEVAGLLNEEVLSATVRPTRQHKNCMRVVSNQLFLEYFPPSGYIQYDGDAPFTNRVA